MRRSLLLAASLLALSCAEPDADSDPDARSDAPAAAVGEVAIYDPQAAWNGYTLAFYRHTYPILVDMRGHLVHAWPEARVKSRVRLLDDCSILGIGTGREIVEYDWRGNQTLSLRFEDRFPHHDVVRLENGNTLALTRSRDESADVVFELDRQGEVIWEWRAEEQLTDVIAAGKRRHAGDATHINSVQELPDNPWHRAGDSRFRPGNILLSARNLNLVLIVDKASKEVVWTYRNDLDLQHEALMLGPSDGDAGRWGHIVLFNNRYSSFHSDRRSRVVEIDPRDETVVWSYDDLGFFSPTSGAQQVLPNDNLLITSSLGRRAFEVDRRGRTVWQWVTPFGLDRSSRYPADHCPELEALGPGDGPPIRPPAGYRHVDRPSHRFARANQRIDRRIDGVRRSLLRPERPCSRVVVPAGASIRLGYGVDRERLAKAPVEGYLARFSLTLRDPESGREAVAFEDEIGPDGPGWRERRVGLDALAHRLVEICAGVSEEGVAESRGGFAFWGVPTILPPGESTETEDEAEPRDLNAEELEVRREHLRAMGYVN